MKTKRGRHDHNNNCQVGGNNWGNDLVDKGCGGGINTTINNFLGLHNYGEMMTIRPTSLGIGAWREV